MSRKSNIADLALLERELTIIKPPPRIFTFAGIRVRGGAPSWTDSRENRGSAGECQFVPQSRGDTGGSSAHESSSCVGGSCRHSTEYGRMECPRGGTRRIGAVPVHQ